MIEVRPSQPDIRQGTFIQTVKHTAAGPGIEPSFKTKQEGQPLPALPRLPALMAKIFCGNHGRHDGSPSSAFLYAKQCSCPRIEATQKFLLFAQVWLGHQCSVAVSHL